MICLQIKNTKNFMNSLLISELFDSFYVEEAVITTFSTFIIDGHTVNDFYTNDEIEEMGGTLAPLSLWRDIRPVCFQLIKGKKTPVSFRVTLQGSPEIIHTIASSPDCGVAENLIRSLVLNIRYENGQVSCITGTSFTTFLVDKSVDKLWDSYIREMFGRLQIDYEEL